MKNLKAFFITSTLFAFVTISQAQTTGLGIGTTAPAASSILDLTSTNKGILMPRVALTGNNDVTTISSPTTSLLIYNTTTGGSPPNDVVPGFYYWSGSIWKQILGFTPRTIGDSYGGGEVFYVYDNGLHGLIVTAADQSTGILWNIPNTTNAVRDGINAGDNNTELIIGKQVYSADYAAWICAHYQNGSGDIFGDWYLPSARELDTLYIHSSSLSYSFTNAYYWSSTEFSGAANAYAENLSTGTKTNSIKSSTYYVRCIRAF